jgi:hypothetical protein
MGASVGGRAWRDHPELAAAADEMTPIEKRERFGG